jgi:hypothetical protein
MKIEFFPLEEKFHWGYDFRWPFGDSPKLTEAYFIPRLCFDPLHPKESDVISLFKTLIQSDSSYIKEQAIRHQHDRVYFPHGDCKYEVALHSLYLSEEYVWLRQIKPAGNRIESVILEMINTSDTGGEIIFTFGTVVHDEPYYFSTRSNEFACMQAAIHVLEDLNGFAT